MAKRNLKAGMNRFEGFGLQAFTRDELDTIHFATLQVLKDTGIKVESEEALKIFHGAGAKVERRDGWGIVKLSGYLVEECIRLAPRTGVYCGRRPQDDVVVEGSRVGFTAGWGEHVKIIDLNTRKVRSTIKQDLAQITRIQDYLNVITVIQRAACSGDQYPPTQSLHNYEAMVANSSKHCFLGFGGGRNTRKIIAMAKIACGYEKRFVDRPIVSGFVCPTSPLTLVKECCEAIVESARGGIGIGINPMSLAGVSSPVTLAGVVVQHNAEVLSALTLAQLTAKGTPCTYCGSSTIMDMRLGSSSVGVPELALLSVAWAKLAQYYQLPSWVGACASDSKTPDVQQAYDFSLTAIPTALAGANTICGIGALESLLTFDYAAMIAGAEQAERVLKVVGGIDISDEALALDVIHAVGPGGEYISHEHTYAHMQTISQSRLFDRRTRDDWLAASGVQDVTERAYEEARRIITTHQPAALPSGAAEDMCALIEEYEAELKADTK